ncbi:hypothetical protein AbraIFM66950_000966 [Aspergillus brasiliensis]|nr:hypothetical protein AbraIFM66950_000966 [Aspergillus brasiliensis]
MTVNRNAVVRAVPAIFLTVTSITVLLRCYVRLKLIKAFGWDDGACYGGLCYVLWRHDRR